MTAEWVHCYVCGRVRKRENFLARNISEGYMQKGDDGKYDGGFIERALPDASRPDYYAMGCCNDCAPKEYGTDWNKESGED